MLAKLYRFRQLAPVEQRLLVRVWWLLAFTRIVLIVVPFRRLVGSLERHPGPLPPAAADPRQLSEAGHIGRLVASAARHTPWRSTCLLQVLVAQRLMRHRRIPGQFCLGVRPARATAGAAEGFAAHAWLLCGDTVVNGAAGHEDYSVLATFRWGDARV